jgi:hypothetical protein
MVGAVVGGIVSVGAMDNVGFDVGHSKFVYSVGDSEGAYDVKFIVEISVGVSVGVSDGVSVGFSVGASVSCKVGCSDGVSVGLDC